MTNEIKEICGRIKVTRAKRTQKKQLKKKKERKQQKKNRIKKKINNRRKEYKICIKKVGKICEEKL